MALVVHYYAECISFQSKLNLVEARHILSVTKM